MKYDRLIACCLFMVGIAGLGCSNGNSRANASVSGKVTYKGQTVKGGTVQFTGPDGVPYNGQIAKDGTYSVTEIPSGDLIITVETDSINPSRTVKSGNTKDEAMRRKMGGGQEPPPGRGGPPTVEDNTANYVKIPEMYSNTKTSPLQMTAKSGRQVFNIELTD